MTQRRRGREGEQRDETGAERTTGRQDGDKRARDDTKRVAALSQAGRARGSTGTRRGQLAITRSARRVRLLLTKPPAGLEVLGGSDHGDSAERTGTLSGRTAQRRVGPAHLPGPPAVRGSLAARTVLGSFSAKSSRPTRLPAPACQRAPKMRPLNSDSAAPPGAWPPKSAQNWGALPSPSIWFFGLRARPICPGFSLLPCCALAGPCVRGQHNTPPCSTSRLLAARLVP